MNRFELTPALETGNRDIDAHVRTLFAIANEIVYSKTPERSPPEFQRALNFFVAYLRYHFSSEETVMEEKDYPSRHLHSDFHAHILHEASALERRGKSPDGLEEARDTLYFMVEDWLVSHVKEEDLQFAEFLREAPAKESIARLPGVRDLKATGSLSPDFDEQMIEPVASLGYAELWPWISPANETTSSAGSSKIQ